ncbi:MAG: hypothetical protein EBX98_07345 [Burkholderiaceae bacterium]|nr:hypothetical protein [Burkholderiaceae bacterium]
MGMAASMGAFLLAAGEKGRWRQSRSSKRWQENCDCTSG